MWLPKDPPPLAIDSNAFIRHYGAKMLNMWKTKPGRDSWFEVHSHVRWSHFEGFLRRGLQWELQRDGRCTSFFAGLNLTLLTLSSKNDEIREKPLENRP